MRELVFREAAQGHVDIPAFAVERFAEVRAALSRRSSIVWGEHCSECAFPSCYSTCEFYTPRSDMHCRRFTHGIEALNVTAAPAIEGLTRIAFRRWGKLEGTGPVQMQSTAKAMHAEKAAIENDARLAKLPLPRPLGSRIANRLNQRRKQRSHSMAMPAGSVFIIEGWLEQAEPITMTVALMPWDKSTDGLFQKQFTFRQGYNREIITTELIRRSMALDQPFAVQIEVVGEVPSQPVVFGMVDFAELATPLAAVSGAQENVTTLVKAKTAKCVVWDLDDTVWTGTLVEDGIEGVVLNPAAAEAMRLLDARGILNSVASKNDEELALAALQHFGLSEYILFPQISWGPKSDAIRRIAESIDIGIDTFVFVDDQPFERGEVGAAHPSVTLMHPDEIAGFATHALFDVSVTEESKKRRFMYRDEEKRQHAATSAGTDYLGFLRTSSIELIIQSVTKESAERVYELTQRTNQLNVTGARFTREQVQQFVEGTATHEGFVLRCKDNFGDYGIIGFCVMNLTQFHIEAFFMSCRVQRKKVENAFFAWLSARVSAMGAKDMTIDYCKTAKNGAAVKMFQELGFTLAESTPGEGMFTRSLGESWADADVVQVESHVATMAS